PGGMCTTPPQQIKYLPSKENPAPSNDWTNAGGTKNDFTNAQACAAQFMLTYLTFDINDTKSLEKSVPMLSVGGKKRFYNHDSDLPIDYMDPAWRASAQKQHLSQTAMVMKPTEVYVQTQNQKFLAWMHIHCKVTVKIDGQSQSHEADYTVLLVKVPLTQDDNNNNDQKTIKGIGWQVSKWRSGSSNYPPPDPL
ncbi:MAG: hypothetical protein J2P36_32010, partial [Ktedonobacteraceae bacterium]|nr:hypothetical protein [Ktedonobacteraceae bacterium]